MSIESISALQECMANLGIDASRHYEARVDAKFFNHRTLAHGNIHVLINPNPHSSEGPFLSFDESIRGFGVQYTEFRPQWVNITYDKQGNSLRLSHSSYDFSLTFGEQE